MSGTSKLQPHPGFRPLAQVLPHLQGRLCYFLEPAGGPGLSVLYRFERDALYLQCGSWAGDLWDLRQPASYDSQLLARFLERYGEGVSKLLATIKLGSAQLYLSEELVLVDVLTGSKWAGPGMLREVFEKTLPTPRVRQIEPLDDRVLAALGTGSYGAPLWLKPSVYRPVELAPGQLGPPYAAIS